MTKTLNLFILLTLCISAGLASAYTPLKNIKVVDGDTIRAEAKGQEIKIRLVEIDAPEMDQPFGLQSKNFLNRLLYKKDVTLIAQGEDRYGRILGNIFSDELNVNLLMVKYGMAWVYEKYAKDSSLFKYQAQAQEEKLGLWRTKEPMAPWVWRKQK